MLYARLIIRDTDDYPFVLKLVAENEEAYQAYKRTITDSGNVIANEFIDPDIGTVAVLEDFKY